MARKIMLSIMTASLLLSNGITAFAAPEVINANGVNTVFDADYYASANPDVAAAFGTNRDLLLLHYTACGMAEGRPAYAPGTDVNALLAAAAVAPVQKKKVRVKHETSDGGIDIDYQYDEQGKLVSEILFSEDGTIYTTTYAYTYDGQGNALTGAKVDGINGDVTPLAYTYDGQGNVLTKTEFYSDGGTRIYTYTYDGQGNVLTENVFTVYGINYTIIYEYTYDEQGNVLTGTKWIDDTPASTYTYIYY